MSGMMVRRYNDLTTLPFHNIYRIDDINDIINCFRNYLSVLFDTHASLRTVRYSVSCPLFPWLTDKYLKIYDRFEKQGATKIQG